MIAPLVIITLHIWVIAESFRFDKEAICIVGSGLIGSLAGASITGLV